LVKGKMLAVAVILVAALAIGIVGCEPEAEEGFREIVGIEPGAGIMEATEEAIPAYELDLELSEGSDAAMTAELSDAIAMEEWILVTGWTPHWKFAEWDLKFLEDPEGVYGEEEYIGNIARLELQDDLPEVYEFLENFYWGDDEIGEVMELNAEDDTDLLGNAQEWVEENRDFVENEWLPEDFGAEAEGQEVEIALVEWECATASTYVAKAVLQEAGYDVEVSTVDAGPMWSAVAEGDVDFISCAWLPVTHGSYWDDYGDDVEEVSTHYEGARIGLVVPEYVDIDSIEEINDYVLE